MQPTHQDIALTIYPIIDCLTADSDLFGQPFVVHPFFIITLRRFNCDSYFTFFILFVIKGLHKSLGRLPALNR